MGHSCAETAEEREDLLRQQPREKCNNIFVSTKQGNTKSFKLNYWLSKKKGRTSRTQSMLEFGVQGLGSRV